MDASNLPTTRSSAVRHMLQDMPVALDAAEIPTNKIVPNPHQPRNLQSRPFDPERNEEDAELVASIAMHGVIQPIGVVALADGTYQLLYGERRWRASMAAGKHTIPAVIKDRDGQLGSEQQAVFALIENLQRSDLSPLEVASALEELQRLTGYTWERIAQLVGKTDRSIRSYRQYNDLDEETRLMVAKAGLSLRHVAALANAPVNAQHTLAQQTIELELPASALQMAVRQIANEPNVPAEIAIQQAANTHKPRVPRQRRQAKVLQPSDSPAEESGVLSPFHEQVIATLLTPPPDAAPQEKREWTLRAKSLREQVTGFGLDVVDTRHAALLMRHNRNLPAPAAVGMAQSLRGTRTGAAIGKIEAALDTLSSGERIVVDLTENQREAVLAISAYLRRWLDIFDHALKERS